eukprot:g8447.t1
MVSAPPTRVESTVNSVACFWDIATGEQFNDGPVATVPPKKILVAARPLSTPRWTNDNDHAEASVCFHRLQPDTKYWLELSEGSGLSGSPHLSARTQYFPLRTRRDCADKTLEFRGFSDAGEASKVFHGVVVSEWLSLFSGQIAYDKYVGGEHVSLMGFVRRWVAAKERLAGVRKGAVHPRHAVPEYFRQVRAMRDPTSCRGGGRDATRRGQRPQAPVVVLPPGVDQTGAAGRAADASEVAASSSSSKRTASSKQTTLSSDSDYTALSSDAESGLSYYTALSSQASDAENYEALARRPLLEPPPDDPDPLVSEHLHRAEPALASPDEPALVRLTTVNHLADWVYEVPGDFLWLTWLAQDVDLITELYALACFTLPTFFPHPFCFVINPEKRFCIVLDKNAECWRKCKQVRRYAGDIRVTVNADFNGSLKALQQYHSRQQKDSGEDPAAQKDTKPAVKPPPPTWLNEDILELLETMHGEANERNSPVEQCIFEFWARRDGKDHKAAGEEQKQGPFDQLVAVCAGFAVNRAYHDYSMATLVKDKRSFGAIATKTVGHILQATGFRLWYWGCKIGYMETYEKYGGRDLDRKEFKEKWLRAACETEETELGAWESSGSWRADASPVLDDGDCSTAQTTRKDSEADDLKLGSWDSNSAGGQSPSRRNILFVTSWGTELGAAHEAMMWLAERKEKYKVAYMFMASDWPTTQEAVQISMIAN